MLQKARFIGSITILYSATIGTLGFLAAASFFLNSPAIAKKQLSPSVQNQPLILSPHVISGGPTRLVVPSATIDLQILPGNYDPATQSWTLSETNVHFANFSSPANDRSGTTFIYGHGTDAVLGKLGSNRPETGTVAQVYTDTGRVFTYELSEIRDFTPNDTSIIDDTSSGAPRLVLQTCTGMFSEWRTMFIFRFIKVE